MQVPLQRKLEKGFVLRNNLFMQSLRNSLPPVNSLIAFEASARHLSFTRAGQELLISREAVSRQIRILENYLKKKLFVRLYRALELTPAGAELKAVVSESLNNIAKTAISLQRDTQPTKITVTATIAITSFWLTPRLSHFSNVHPQVDISISATDTPLKMMEAGSDIGILYGKGKWPGYKSTFLFDVESFPVCSPRYLEKSRPLTKLEDLNHHTLLYLTGTMHAVENWDWWMESLGLAAPKNARKLEFDSYDNVIQAAMDSQGIALAFTNLTGEQLVKGRLVRPLDHGFRKGNGIYLVAPRGKPLNANAKKFFDWVVEEAKA
ncbi:MAG: LysR family transcriptional regulator [Alphaproteobacteria bacterium]|nr:LysR family transcriptional regulator [Alphaproteobacteria bacterium]